MKKKSHVRFGVTLKGFMTMEILISLIIAIIIFNILYLDLKLNQNIKFKNYADLEQRLGIIQLRYYLNANKISINEDDNSQLIVETAGGEKVLNVVNNKLMLQDGSLTFLKDINSIYFYIEDGYIKMNLISDDRNGDYWIGFNTEKNS